MCCSVLHLSCKYQVFLGQAVLTGCSPMWGHASVAVQIPAPHSHVYPLYCPLLSPLTLHSLLLYSTRPRLYSVIRTEDLHPYMYIVLFWRQLPRPSAVTSHARNITIRQMLARRGDTKVHLDTHPRRGARMYFDVQHRGTRSVGFCSTAGHMLRVNNALFPRPTHNTC